QVRSTIDYDLTSNTKFPELGYFMLGGENFDQYMGAEGGLVNLYFYDSVGDFIEAVEAVYMYDELDIPDGAETLRISLNQTNTTQIDEDHFGNEIGIR